MRAWLTDPANRPKLAIGVILVALAALGLNAAILYSGETPRQLDWRIFFDAAEAMRLQGDPYAGEVQGYIYPPGFAWALQPATALGYSPSAAIWMAITVGLAGLALWMLSGHVVDLLGLAPPRLARAVIFVLSALLVIEKIATVLRRAQTDAVILACLVLGLVWIRRLPVAAGLALALAVAVKYHALIFLPVLLLWGRFTAAAAMVAGMAALFLLPALTVGWDANLALLERAFGGLGNMMGADTGVEGAAGIYGVTWERSVSLTSTAFRLTEGGALVILALLAAAVVAGVLALYRARGVPWPFFRETGLPAEGRPREAILLEWGVIVAVILVFSPQTTARHMLIGVIPIAIAIGLIWRHWPSLGAKILAGLVALFVLSLSLPPSDWEAGLMAWRAIGGPSWCLVALCTGMLLLWSRRE